jgi:MFS transporter, PAT family, beta-lactamase induction signal transducer AmpG
MSKSSMAKILNIRLLAILLLGFAGGLPLALTGQSMQAWLTVDKIDMATIGFFSLVGIPYTFKFLWAPLMDRFELPFFGRRRGWLVLTQGLLALILWLMAQTSPSENTQQFALVALLVAFLSASQDIVIDAYRTDILHHEERGLGSSLYVFGYRLAMILSGGIAFVWADPVNGNGWTWAHIYQVMAAIMLGAMVISFTLLPKVPKDNVAPATNAKNDLRGFLALVVVAVFGYQLTTKGLNPLFVSGATELFGETDPAVVDSVKKLSANATKWIDFLVLLLGIAITLPLAWWASKKAKFETLNISLENYFSMKGAMSFLAFIILYKLGDAFAGSLLTPFLLNGVGYSQAEIGVVNKVIGMWLTIFGAIAGGALMVRLNLYRSLMLFGILQLVSNLGFWVVAVQGKGAWGSFSLPAFDWMIVTLKESSNVDWLLLVAVATENLTGGMGTAAFVALLMALCNQKFTATQYSLLSAFSSVGRVWVGPLAGTLTTVIGWPVFFIVSIFMAIPGLVMLQKLKPIVKELEAPVGANLMDD